MSQNRANAQLEMRHLPCKPEAEGLVALTQLAQEGSTHPQLCACPPPPAALSGSAAPGSRHRWSPPPAAARQAGAAGSRASGAGRLGPYERGRRAAMMGAKPLQLLPGHAAEQWLSCWRLRRGLSSLLKIMTSGRQGSPATDTPTSPAPAPAPPSVRTGQRKASRVAPTTESPACPSLASAARRGQ